MPILRIHDRSDQRLEPYRQLKIIRKELARQLFICEGMLLLERLLDSGYGVHSVLTIERQLDEVLRRTAGQDEITIYVISDDSMDELVGFDFHRGVLACGYRRPAGSIRIVLEQTEHPVTLVGLPQIQDPGNFGGILRLAGGFGVAGIVVGEGCPDPFSRRVLRVSMGGALRVPVWPAEHFADHVKFLAEQFQVVPIAAVLGADAVPLHKLDWPRRTLLILGREDVGLADEIVAVCSQKVTIPMYGGTDSLNVAVTAGIMLHAISARRG
jgi:tRNA G18 (ribose-2'-O)-methylase SpoU